ncbi:Gfo/Idh/MocA family protein [Draconibacterium halophilum]|uniref:Gfo/Idh/MocA family oxidoreductase n=1 Tax=Draconibacterium halophilum TaxID=2706887 RepID=A0A6C0RAR2_9BACT|nr:Gfo/Idh/MocA family oxidoreductase [Draconibacterium halophilum]QIA07179.1 Gfo/Idh/MocA family oxidoreductase [Draconibacterium halophilum]
MERRKFIKQSAASAAAFTIIPGAVLGRNSATPANSKINVAFIGTGKQGCILQNFFKTRTSETITVAACDVDSQKLNKFIGIANEANKEHGNSVKIFATKHYREILERSDVDAVVIATPDHWHAQVAIDACKAGKDVYCEKPMASTVAEGRAMVNATRKYDRVFQTGNMQRSSFNFRQACELVAGGYIGEIKEVNAGLGGPVVACDLPSMEAPANLDWNLWVGPSPYRAFHPELSPPVERDIYPNWRNYRNFGGGMITDWGAHMFDIGQWGLQMDNSGPSVYIPPKDRATHGLKMIYENGVVLNHVKLPFGNGVEFIGTEGKIEVSRGHLKTMPNEKLAKMEIKPEDRKLYFCENHYQNWLDAIKDRSKPISDVEVGHRTSSLCNLANIAYELERSLQWDPEKEEFIGDASASMMLSRPYRGEWDFMDY